jgi:glycosyltransferase involved in cell wall biosynthesis
MTLDLFGHEDREFGTLASYFLPNLARAQVVAGHSVEVHLLTSSRPSSLSLDGVAVTFHACLQPPAFMGLHRRFGRQVSVRMLGKVTHRNPNVIHFHGVRNCQLMFAAVARRATRSGIPLVAHDQGSREGWFLEDRAFLYGLRRAAALIAANAESAERFRSEGVPEEAVHTIPNGYDPGVFFPDEIVGRRRDSTPLRVLLVSRLTAEKDPLTAAKGMATFAEKCASIDVTLIGSGPLRGEVETRLRSAAERLIAYDRVSQKELGEYYRGADVLVLTSLGEGSNQTVVEAMACGLPVIASDVRGIRDVVDGAGILVPPGDPTAVAAALRRVSEEPMLLGALRERGLDRARTLTWGAVVAEIDGVYDHVLELGRGRT